MDQNIDNYTKIHKAIFIGFCFVFFILAITSIDIIEKLLIDSIGEYAFLIFKIAPWGIFGALMHASFLSAKDKHANFKKEKAREKDEKLEEPIYPDSYDVSMYYLYFMSGLVLAILSVFLLEMSIDYVSSNGGNVLKERYGLFSIFAFYAGYSQSDLVGKLNRKARESSNSA